MTQTSSDENCIHILENKVSYKVQLSNKDINIIRSISYSQVQYQTVICQTKWAWLPGPDGHI